MEKKMADTLFNNHEFLKYLVDYDYICQKYKIDKNDPKYVDCSIHESLYQSADVVKRDYASIYENIQLVYGDSKTADKMIMVYKIIKEEVVNKFLNIPGLERLYDEHFFEFEWDMHSRLDFDSHNISFYRDHFVHQVRNFFEMNRLLEDKYFYENFKEEFLNGNNKISSFVKQGVKRLLYNTNTGSYCPKYLNSLKPDVRADYLVSYIIKASVALSSLFHDIGYPILHYKKLHKRISVFMPSMYMFLNNGGNDFEHIYALLCNSLLFRIVSKDELYTMTCDKDNHGTISAIAFLLTFYENGIIDKIGEDKRIAIEIAAVAIYNHTLKYVSIDNSEADNYYTPVYKLNPLSYLLRICDDIQEWERTYFEIQDIPDIMLCPKCGTPAIRSHEKTDVGKSFFSYTCHCKKTECIRYNDFTRRKIIDIINCKEVCISFQNNPIESFMHIHIDYNPALLLKMCIMAPRYSKYRIKEGNKIKKLLKNQRFGGYNSTIVSFFLTSNPFMLKSLIIGELAALDKKDFTDHFDKANVNAFYNIVSILTEHFKDFETLLYISFNGLYFATILNETNDNVLPDADINNSIDFWFDDWLDDFMPLIHEKHEDLIENILSIYPGRKKNLSLTSKNVKSMIFYYLLYIVGSFFSKTVNKELYNKNQEYKKTKAVLNLLVRHFQAKLCKIADILLPNIPKDEIYTFINDAIEQYSKLFDIKNIDAEMLCCDEYYNQFDTKPIVYNSVESYTYMNHPINKSLILDYYSDLDLYIKFDEYTQFVKKQKISGGDFPFGDDN